MMMMKVNQNVSFIYTDVVALAQLAPLDSVYYSLLTRGQFSTERNTTNSKKKYNSLFGLTMAIIQVASFFQI